MVLQRLCGDRHGPRKALDCQDMAGPVATTFQPQGGHMTKEMSWMPPPHGDANSSLEVKGLFGGFCSQAMQAEPPNGYGIEVSRA